MDVEKLQELIRLFEDSSFVEIEIEEEGRRICLRKTPSGATQMTPMLPMAHMPYHPYASPHALAHHPAMAPQPPQAAQPDHQPGTAPEAAKDKVPGEDEGLVTIDSPMVGVFYEAPAPGEAPFAKPGDTVQENQTICIVEAMKLMNEVVAKFTAQIVKVLVENGEPVEFGQPLFAVKPLD